MHSLPQRLAGQRLRLVRPSGHSMTNESYLFGIVNNEGDARGIYLKVWASLSLYASRQTGATVLKIGESREVPKAASNRFCFSILRPQRILTQTNARRPCPEWFAKVRRAKPGACLIEERL